MPKKIQEPNQLTYIPPVAPAFGGVLQVPDGKLFVQEYSYWDKERDAADRLGHTTIRAIAQMFGNELIAATKGRLAIQAMAEGHLVANTAYMLEWQRRTVAAISMSRLLRHSLFQQDSLSRTLATSLDKADICLNIEPKNPENNTLLIANTSLRGVMDIEPTPNSTTWYEYDDVYAKAESPASASPNFRNNFADFFGRTFEETAFTSFTPLIKQEVWMAEY